MMSKPVDRFRLPDLRKQEWLNYLHSENPEPGDYWCEFFSPYYTVLEVDPCFVRVIHHIGPNDNETIVMSRDLFKTKMRYNSPGLSHLCIADVRPGRNA